MNDIDNHGNNNECDDIHWNLCGFRNPRAACGSSIIPHMDLSPWKEHSSKEHEVL